MTTSKCPVTHLTMNNGAPVADNQNSLTAVCTPKVRARSVRLP